MDSGNVIEQRELRRILAVCRVLDMQRRFLGFTLDLNKRGIKIIIQKDFPPRDELEVFLTQAREDNENAPDIKVKIKQAWRISTNEEFDQIGGVIVEVDSPENLELLISECDRKARERYQLDWH